MRNRVRWTEGRNRQPPSTFQRVTVQRQASPNFFI